ncbi:ribose 5-phosphate isomerase B [Candidatus Woesearchaeota archaeon]|nr:ribose 5-phosphate isomerase B [Candidatus Woesearchaeota archaeon]
MRKRAGIKDKKVDEGFIVIGSDHAGLKLKEKIKDHLISRKKNIVDAGAYSKTAVDYPDYADKVTGIVKKKKKAKGILICGTGTGMCMAANRKRGIRAAVGYDTYSAKMSRNDNDANVLCLRGRNIKIKDQLKIVDTWLRADFSAKKRHERRINKLDSIR